MHEAWRVAGALEAADKLCCRVERPADGHIHIEIAVGAEPAGEGDPGFVCRALNITREEPPVVDEMQRIIGNVLRSGAAAVFAEDDGPFERRRFPGREM